MNSRTILRANNRGRGIIFAAVVVTFLMVLAPIALGHHVMGTLPLSAGLLHGLVLPLTLLFVLCLISFSWEARIIMIVCVGGLFLLSVPVMKGLRTKLQQRGVESASLLHSNKATFTSAVAR